jgi:hypothetical protein
LVDRTFNEHRTPRPPMREDSEKLLKDFYQPFNMRLYELLKPGGSRNLKNWPPSSILKGNSEGETIDGGDGGHEGEVDSSSVSGRDGELEYEGNEGDADADKFLWEDTWSAKDADKPVMKSFWENDKVPFFKKEQ